MNKEELEKARELSQKMDSICQQILENPQSNELKQAYKEIKNEIKAVLNQTHTPKN